MDLNFYVSSIIGFVPSFAILYASWGNLEGLFSEKKLFFNYFIGWIIGIIIALFFLISMVAVRQYLDLSIIFVVIFAIFTEMAKYIYLNAPKKREDYALPYYGFSFGLGIAAIWSVSLTYFYLRMPMSSTDYLIASISFFFLSIGMAALHASTGSMLGYGIFKKDWEKYLLESFGFAILFNITLLPYIWGMPYYLYVFGVIISIPVMYYKIYKGILLYTIPKRVMKEWKESQESLQKQ